MNLLTSAKMSGKWQTHGIRLGDLDHAWWQLEHHISDIFSAARSSLSTFLDGYTYSFNQIDHDGLQVIREH
jgi:hypothetical protein